MAETIGSWLNDSISTDRNLGTNLKKSKFLDLFDNNDRTDQYEPTHYELDRTDQYEPTHYELDRTDQYEPTHYELDRTGQYEPTHYELDTQCSVSYVNVLFV